MQELKGADDFSRKEASGSEREKEQESERVSPLILAKLS
jgi:hypothetical protein